MWTDFRHPNLRNLRGNFGERNLVGKTKDCVAERVGFELAVRLAKFAFDFSTEFPASSAKSGFGEKFAPEVLNVSVHLVSVVRLVRVQCGYSLEGGCEAQLLPSLLVTPRRSDEGCG